VSVIDPLGPDFAYIQVANHIAARIEVGEISQTVRHAMQVLRERGLIVTRQGRGTFVAPVARN